MDAPDPKAVPIVCGPTGSGKTGVALALADQFPVEVVSADSRQIIRHLNIGTAKPTPYERNKVTFHLVDTIEPGERYSAFRFVEDANAAIAGILERGRIPLVVGGTGLYLRALTEGVVEIENDDLAVREKLEAEMEKIGPEVMHDRLAGIDPLEAAKLHPNNRVRVIRALEIFHLTGRTKSELMNTGGYAKSTFEFVYYCLLPDRQALYEAINARVDEMISQGLVEELRLLVEAGRADDVRRAQVIGYSELLDFLGGEVSLEEAIARIKQNTRRYAKRQYTWFSRQAACRVFSNPVSLGADLATQLKLY